MPSLTIKITNESGVAFTKEFSHEALTLNETLNNAPSEVLEAEDGQTTMAASQNSFAEGLGTDVYSIQCAYRGGDLSFGVFCQQNAQVFAVGDPPFYSVTDGKGGWTKMSSGLAHTWTSQRLKATATPTVQHDSISVDVVVTDVRTGA